MQACLLYRSIKRVMQLPYLELILEYVHHEMLTTIKTGENRCYWCPVTANNWQHLSHTDIINDYGMDG